MPQDAPHCFVVAGMMLEIEGCSRVPKLVGRNLQSCRFINSLGDLIAKRRQTFKSAVFAGEQPGFVCAAQQHGTEMMKILIDQLGEVFIQFEVQVDLVLHVVVGKHQPIG